MVTMISVTMVATIAMMIPMLRTMATVLEPVDDDGNGESEDEDTREGAKATDDLPWLRKVSQNQLSQN